MTSAEAFEAYEASDEASESELLDRSLSLWKGWGLADKSDSINVPHDIHTASSIGHYEYVRSLILRGDVLIDKKNKGSWTPLMYACYIGHDNIVNLLIEMGCDVNVKNQQGQTPLMLAASCGNETVGRTLCQSGAELEAADRKGWTALFHATYAGHQNFVQFLLEYKANMDAVEPACGKTPFLEAATEGHEIIIQLFLHYGVDINVRAFNGDMARSLALLNDHMKVVSLIDNHVMPISTLRSEPELDGDLSSSDETYHRPRHHPVTRNSKTKHRDPNITDGPRALERLIDRGNHSAPSFPNSCVPKGYVTFPQPVGIQEIETKLSYRDVTSPINPEDYTLDSSGGRESCEYEDDGNAFSKTGAITIKSSSSSSGGLAAALGLDRTSSDSDEIQSSESNSSKCNSEEISSKSESSNPLQDEQLDAVENDGDNKPQEEPSQCAETPVTIKNMEGNSDHIDPQYSNLSDINPSVKNSASIPDPEYVKTSTRNHPGPHCLHPESGIPFDYQPSVPPPDTPAGMRRPVLESMGSVPGEHEDMNTLLGRLGLQKYLLVFDEQDVDLQMFLSLTDNDLKEVGIKLFGPRKKMTNAIARWHSRAPLSSSSLLEQSYADRLEGKMQEMAIQLNQMYAGVEKMKAQVLQEQQLRSVTEGCLVEERSRVHHISMDTRFKCSDIKDTIKKLKHFHAEIKERVISCMCSNDSQSQDTTKHSESKQSFSVEERSSRPANDGQALSLEILLRKVELHLKNIQHTTSLILVSCEHLIDKGAKSDAIDQGYG